APTVITTYGGRPAARAIGTTPREPAPPANPASRRERGRPDVAPSTGSPPCRPRRLRTRSPRRAGCWLPGPPRVNPLDRGDDAARHPLRLRQAAPARPPRPTAYGRERPCAPALASRQRPHSPS